MKKLKAQTYKIKDICSETISEMYNLYAQYYDAINEQRFRDDLHEKDYVILVINSNNVICGFSALQHYKVTIEDVICWIAYSGDTIVHHQHWGDQSLALEWCKLVGYLKAEHPERPLYWFLVSKGHRTYRYLNAFAKSYYPNKKLCIPYEMKTVMDYLAKNKFGDYYKSQTGVVAFPESLGHLKPEWDDINEHENRNEDARFFLSCNPKYKQGHELVCLAELSQSNFRSFGLDKFKEGLNAKSVG